MSVSAKDFLTTAEKNLLLASSEADLRCCVTRAYYASYNAALEFEASLLSPGVCSPSGGDHENLIHKLKHPTISKTDDNYIVCKELSRYLFKMRYQRITSDYKLNENITKLNADTTIAEANMVFDTIP